MWEQLDKAELTYPQCVDSCFSNHEPFAESKVLIISRTVLGTFPPYI